MQRKNIVGIANALTLLVSLGMLIYCPWPIQTATQIRDAYNHVSYDLAWIEHDPTMLEPDPDIPEQGNPREMMQGEYASETQSLRKRLHSSLTWVNFSLAFAFLLIVLFGVNLYLTEQFANLSKVAWLGVNRIGLLVCLASSFWLWVHSPINSINQAITKIIDFQNISDLGQVKAYILQISTAALECFHRLRGFSFVVWGLSLFVCIATAANAHFIWGSWSRDSGNIEP